jgi:hypothetical protein
LTTINNEELWAEVWRLVAECDSQRPAITKEYRLYYNDDGTVIGLWETDHPADGNYIVLDDPDIFHRISTNLLKVVDNKLTIIDTTPRYRVNLVKGTSGQRVVKGHAAVALTPEEEHSEIEYYEPKNN